MNGDKCTSHDECFKRLYTKIETMAEKLDSLIAAKSEHILYFEVGLFSSDMVFIGGGA